MTYDYIRKANILPLEGFEDQILHNIDFFPNFNSDKFTMASTATESSTFPLFSSLPPELRSQIWRDALPDKARPALYFYKKSCWRSRRLSETILNFNFRYDILDEVHFEFSLVFVNHEARRVALAWVHEQGIKIRPRRDKQRPVFVCPFKVKRAPCYVTLDKWEDFLREPDNRTFQPHLSGEIVDIEPDLERIAVPDALLRSKIDTLLEMPWCRFGVQMLFIPVDAQPHDGDMTVQKQWKLESIQGEVFSCNYECASDVFGDSAYIGDEVQASKKLVEGRTKNDMRNFGIRPIFAVRR